VQGTRDAFEHNFDQPQFVVNMHVDDLGDGKGPKARYMVELAVTIGNATVVLNTATQGDAELAEFNKRLVPVGAKVT
jgi:hypothetical protein